MSEGAKAMSTLSGNAQPFTLYDALWWAAMGQFGIANELILLISQQK